jgi:serine/threonine protein kinase
MSHLGPYRLLAQLGRGGMAEVHRAERPTNLAAGGPTDCVVKVLRADKANSVDLARMFEAEIRLMSRLHHPNIVRTYDGGIIDGRPYLAMELCTGANLHQLGKALALEGLTFPPEVAVFIAHEIAQALAYVHSLPDRRGRRMGLVHRDVSPSNIMLLDSGAVKLLDFGVAKATRPVTVVTGSNPVPRPEQTRVDTIKGKLRYMAPEQVLGRPLDGRSDLFAVGVILWELLAGRSLFARETPQETGA